MNWYWDMVDMIKHAANRIYLDAQYDLPVSIPALTEYLGVEYHEESLPIRVNGIYHAISSTEALICVTNHPLKTCEEKREAGGHEIGHHIAIQELGICDAHYLSISEGIDKTPLEHLCDLFSRCLLMPESAVLELQDRGVGEMAHFFGVREYTARQRLKELGL